MGKYVAKRLVETALILLLVSFLTFSLLSIVPGDPVARILGENADTTLYDSTRVMFGLDKPFLLQYWNWLTGIFHGDFGISYVSYEPVTKLLGERLPITVFLSLMSILCSTVVGVLLGCLAAVYHGKKIDLMLNLAANLVNGIPTFWLGIVLIYLFAIKWNIFPLYGFQWPRDGGWKSCILPILCMSIGSAAMIMRQTRFAILEVIRQDYVRTARAKGVGYVKVMIRHVLRNAWIPVITILGMRFSSLIGGSIFIEQVFLIPGIGQLLITSVQQMNVPVIQACVLLITAVGCIANLVVDLLYGIVNPQIHLR